MEASLHAAGESQSSFNTAFESFQEAIINAYVNAGISKSKHAKIIEISTEEMLRASSSLSSETRLALERSSAKRKSHVQRRAMEEDFESANTPQSQRNDVISAGVTLETSIDAAASVSEINAAFNAYHDTVVEQLRLVLNAHSASITSIDASINSAGGAKAVLTTSLAAAVSTDAVINAYVNFYNSVSTLVETQLSAATSAEINSTIAILIVANM